MPIRHYVGMECKSCTVDKPEEDFAPRREKYRTGKRRTTCRLCVAVQQRERYERHKRNSWFKLKASRARSRSQHLRVPYDLDAEYLESIWTGFCPVLGIPLDKLADRTSEEAAELDRFIPNKGYVKGNVTFISRKVNRLKNNASIEELERLIDWMKKFERQN